MSGLRDILTSRIAQTGPMSIADYMATCLMHPEHGYYSTRDPFGAQGDFITAPEISQMFGELLGLCLAQCWLDQGAPKPFTLAELGPGRGTLMADILRATARVPGFHDAANIHLVEASPTLRQVQAETLKAYTPEWHDTVTALPDAPLFLVANEFFDALPIRQFIRDGDGWAERVIGLSDGELAFGRTDALPLSELDHRLEDTKDGDLVETCTPAQTIMSHIGAMIGAHGGAALIIDYGDWRSLGDTFQALQAQKKVGPLDNPGNADLTAHVDFEALVKTCAPAVHSRLTPQGVFLERLGITPRAQALAAKLSGGALETHIAAHRRLTHPDEMGLLFKVIGITPDASTTPPGLEP